MFHELVDSTRPPDTAHVDAHADAGALTDDQSDFDNGDTDSHLADSTWGGMASRGTSFRSNGGAAGLCRLDSRARSDAVSASNMGES